METRNSILGILWRDYKGLGIGGVILVLIGQLLLNNFFNWVNTLLVPVWDWIKTMFSGLNVSPVPVTGWLLTLLGVGIIIALLIKVQYDIKKNILEVVPGRHFFNETVVLDGKHFVDCVFEHCTLVWRGGVFTNADYQFKSCIFVFDSKPVIETIRFLKSLSFLEKSFAESFRVGEKDYFRKGVTYNESSTEKTKSETPQSKKVRKRSS